MSRARLVITAVVIEGRSQAEVARSYGVSPGWVSRLVSRYRAEGEAAFEPRSRRPKSSPARVSDEVIGLIGSLRSSLVIAGLDAGPRTIAWHLEHHHGVRVSPATISRHLGRLGLVEPQPKKRPKSSFIRFEAAMPNECWQSDFTHVRLSDEMATDVEVLTFLDDHSRTALHVSAHHRVTGRIVTSSFLQTVGIYGVPASTLTDNGMVFTTRFSGGKGGRNGFETELRRLGVTQKNSRPNHPTTCGKVERFQKTMKQWLSAKEVQPTTIGELQVLLDEFRTHYNEHRPHSSLEHRSTPHTAYLARPKATPGGREDDNHSRVRRDKVDKAGKVSLRFNGELHSIGLGRTHAGTPVLLLVQDLDVHVVDAATGELIRALQIDPSRRYHGTGRPPGPAPRLPKPQS